jgi:hypothetical protein
MDGGSWFGVGMARHQNPTDSISLTSKPQNYGRRHCNYSKLSCVHARSVRTRKTTSGLKGSLQERVRLL